jgi:hypothetical protein
MNVVPVFLFLTRTILFVVLENIHRLGQDDIGVSQRESHGSLTVHLPAYFILDLMKFP